MNSGISEFYDDGSCEQYIDRHPMIRVQSVATIENFGLIVSFSTGESRRFDMRPYLSLPVFRRLENPGFFALARVDYGTVVWPDDIDIAPETLYAQSLPYTDPTVSVFS